MKLGISRLAGIPSKYIFIDSPKGVNKAVAKSRVAESEKLKPS